MNLRIRTRAVLVADLVDEDQGGIILRGVDEEVARRAKEDMEHAVFMSEEKDDDVTCKISGETYRVGDVLPDGRLVESIEDGIPILAKKKTDRDDVSTPF